MVTRASALAFAFARVTRALVLTLALLAATVCAHAQADRTIPSAGDDATASDPKARGSSLRAPRAANDAGSLPLDPFGPASQAPPVIETRTPPRDSASPAPQRSRDALSPRAAASQGERSARAAAHDDAGDEHSARGREPSVTQVVRMASRAARSLDPARLRELAFRARLAGLAPELRFTAERGFDQDITASTTSLRDSTRAAIGDQLRFAAALTFELDRLVFAPEEVRLLSVERWLAGDRRKLLSEVVRLYFQRRRLLREQATARVPDPELDDSLRETEALLDALTAGAFVKALRAPVAR